MENSYSQFKMIFFDVLKSDSTYNWEKKLLIIVNVLKFLHMRAGASYFRLVWPLRVLKRYSK